MCPKKGAFADLFIHLRNCHDQPFAVPPAEAGVCDGLAVGLMVGDGLAALLDVTLDHNALDQLFDLRGELAAGHDLPDDTDLLFELLVGVGVVGVHDAGGVNQIHLMVHS